MTMKIENSCKNYILSLLCLHSNSKADRLWIFLWISLPTFPRTHFREWELSFPLPWHVTQILCWGRQEESRRRRTLFFRSDNLSFFPLNGGEFAKHSEQTPIPAPAYRSGCVAIPLPGVGDTCISWSVICRQVSWKSALPWNCLFHHPVRGIVHKKIVEGAHTLFFK